MKNINSAGPSEERQAQVDALMAKLRQRGSIGDSSLTQEAASFMRAPPPPPPPAPQEMIIEQPVVEFGAGKGWLFEDPEAAEEEGEVKKTTSGIGGSWDQKAATKVGRHKPTKAGSWGVFERPADISKAYGGGRQIGVGGYQVSEEEIAKKRAETEARLKKYRKGFGADEELEAAHKDEIVEAAKEARQLMRFGATKAALEELTNVRQWLCATTELGSETLLELGMAMIAENDNEGAKPILICCRIKRQTQRCEARAALSLGWLSFPLQCPSLSPTDRCSVCVCVCVCQVKRAAQQMLFQEEAQAFMGIDKQQPANAEFAKMARGGLSRSLGVEYDRRYDTAGAFLTSSKRPPVASISEARMVLRSAAVRRDDAGAPQRIQQALSYVSSLPVKERIPSAKVMAVAGSGGGDGAEKPPTPEAATTGLLRGEWLLGLTVTGSGKAIAFAPPEASLTVTPSSGSYEKLRPQG